MTDVPHHDELPLPDYDHLPLGSIESRIRTLDANGVVAVLAYERAHADRLPVVQLLEHRLDQLGSGAVPTGGNPLEQTPEVQHRSTGSPVAPDTQAPPTPPTQGGKTNPAGRHG